jgi:hypothetical protein
MGSCWILVADADGDVLLFFVDFPPVEPCAVPLFDEASFPFLDSNEGLFIVVVGVAVRSVGTPKDAAIKLASESTNADAVASWFILNSFTFEDMDSCAVLMDFFNLSLFRG